jgi:ATP-dependent Clp protease ATP-binding subunit ClpA
MIAAELELSLHNAFVDARRKRHEFITVEHLLLALLGNPSAADVLRACGANLDALRKTVANHTSEQTPQIRAGRDVDTQPTLGFQRVIQRAILHVQSSGKKEVTGANVLVAIFGEEDSHAVYFLQEQGVARLDVLNYVAHGFTKPPSSPASDSATGTDVQVVIYDDDATPMQFLAHVLQKFFVMSREDAAETMLDIYRGGSAVCGLYSAHHGAVLVEQIVAEARNQGYPLRCEVVVPKSA